MTNAVTGIATAYMDSIPMVVITGQVPTHAIGEDAFQECDTVGITRPCVKHNFLVKDVNELAVTIKKAFHIATTGRPGPVLVDIPKDVSTRRRASTIPRRSACARTTRSPRATAGQIKKALQLLLDAKRPMIYVGGGAILGEASAEVTELVRLLGFPVHQHADGPGLAIPPTTSSSSACSACTARSKPTWRCRTATCCSPWARASTTA